MFSGPRWNRFQFLLTLGELDDQARFSQQLYRRRETYSSALALLKVLQCL